MELYGGSWFLLRMMAVLLAGAGIAAGGPEPPAVPLSTTSQLTLVFRTLSLALPASIPDGYSSSQMKRWAFLKQTPTSTTVPGYVIITKNDMGPLFGTLTEMFYIPGTYKPVCTSSTPDSDKYYSAARVWVDNQLSQMVGRTLWGFPKEMATFAWTDDSITVKDYGGHNIMFQANFSAAVSSSSNLPSYFTTLAAGIHTIQYPIDDIMTRFYIKAVADPANQASLALAPHVIQVMIAQSVIAAKARAASKVKNQVANTQLLYFIPTEGPQPLLSMATGVSVKLESKYFTGSRKQLVVVSPAEAGFIAGSPGMLMPPAAFRCY